MKKYILFLTLSILLCGCQSFIKPEKEVIIIEQDDIPVAMQYNGKDGYWISKPRMMSLFEICERYQQLLNNKNTSK